MSCAATMPVSHGGRSAATCPSDFGFPIDVHAHEPDTIYVVPIKSDSEHYPPDGSCASIAAGRAATSGRRSRTACRRVTVMSTCSATRWRLTRWRIAAFTSARPGARSTHPPTPGTTGRPSCGPPGRPVGRGPDAAMIRVVLPAHLRTLARVGGEVELGGDDLSTQRAVLDALEAATRCCAARSVIRAPAAPGVRPVLRR